MDKGEFRKQYIKHLNRVCSNAEWRGYAVEFFDALSKKYDGKMFTRDNFLSLKIAGNEIEQDAVKALFKDKEQVSADELFCYLFKKNVQELSKIKLPRMSDTSGFFDPHLKYVGIIERPIYVKMPSIVKPISNIPPNETKEQKKQRLKDERERKKQSKIEAREIYKRQYEAIKRERSLDYKNTLFHELSHVFEVQTFNNGRYIVTGQNQRLNVCGAVAYSVNLEREITTEVLGRGLKEALSRKRKDFDVDMFIDRLRGGGARALSEVLNEEFACKVNGTFKLVNKPSFICDSEYLRKVRFETHCSYAEDYDIAALLQLAIKDYDSDEIRFNALGLADKINGLNISDEALQAAKKGFVENFAKIGEIPFQKELEERLSKADKYETIALLMGEAGSSQQYFGDEIVNSDDFKIVLQNMLVSAIKEDIMDKLNDESVVKNEEFFKGVNETMTIVDGVVCRSYKKESFNDQRGSSICFTEDKILSNKEYAQRYPELKYFKDMAEIEGAITQCACEKFDELKDPEKSLSYFLQQERLDEKLEQLKENSAIFDEEERKNGEFEAQHAEVQEVSKLDSHQIDEKETREEEDRYEQAEDDKEVLREKEDAQQVVDVTEREIEDATKKTDNNEREIEKKRLEIERARRKKIAEKNAAEEYERS